MRLFRIYLVLLTCLYISSAYASTPLKAQLRAAQHDSTRLRLYSELARHYFEQNMFDSSLIPLKIALKLSEKLKITRYYSDLYVYYGIWFREHNQFNQFVKMSKLALEFGKKNAQYESAEKAGYNLARAYADLAYNTGKKDVYVSSIKQIFDNIKFSEQHSSFVYMLNNYSLLYDMYKDNGQDSLAYLYLEKQLTFLKKSKEERDKIYFLANSIDLNLYKKNFQTIQSYLNQLLTFQCQEKNIGFYQYVLTGVTTSAVKSGAFDIAFNLIQDILNTPKIMSNLDNHWKFILNHNLATIYLHKKNYRLAEQAHTLAVHFSKKEVLAFGDQLKLMINQQKIFEHQRKYEEALTLNKRINTMQDSITSAQFTFELAINEERLSYENKERFFDQQLKIHQLEDLQKAQTLKNAKQLQKISIYIIFLLFVVIAIIAFQIQKIMQQSTVLKQMNETQNKLFAIIGHDLRSPIVALYQSFERMSRLNVEIQKKLPQISNLLLTTDNLLYWAKKQQSGMVSQPKAIALTDIIAEVLEQLEASIETAQISIHNKVPETTVVHADENHLLIIIRNIVQNAIKFTPAKGIISFHIEMVPLFVNLVIKDTGVGFDKSKEFPQKKGTGLGLKLVKELIELNQGRITFINKEGKGAEVLLSFKIC